jgi:hypothetical protein
MNPFDRKLGVGKEESEQAEQESKQKRQPVYC